MTHAVSVDKTPEFPMTRAERCPFDPPPGLRELRDDAPALTRVQLWDGSTPWIVTRHAEQRTERGKPPIGDRAQEFWQEDQEQGADQ